MPNSVMQPILDKIPVVEILGVPVHRITMEGALDRIATFIRKGVPRHVVTADASMLVTAQEDASLRGIIARADLITPDSTGILWAARRAGRPMPERVSGVEIVERLCKLSADCGYRIYFFGAAPGIAEKAALNMTARYSGAQIVGTRSGFFTADDEPTIIEDIRRCRPDVLCVALGIPKQEKWISEHLADLEVPVAIGVGGTLDVLSGATRRAPLIFQKAHLEWLWRVISNPRKIKKVLLLPRFISLVRRGA